MMWYVCIGLQELDLPLLAHVSWNLQGGIVFPTKRCWVGISTPPLYADGLPIVVNQSGKVEVQMLFGPAENEHNYDPCSLPNVEVEFSGQYHSAQKWTEYFTRRLQEKRISIGQDLLEAAKETERLARLLLHLKTL